MRQKSRPRDTAVISLRIRIYDQTMNNGINIKNLLPDGFRAMMDLTHASKPKHISHTAAQLIKIRASQINGCAFCQDMHTSSAREAGETEERISAISGWPHSPLFSDQEKMILAMTEEITLVPKKIDPEVLRRAEKLLNKKEMAEVALTAVVINAWNRIMILAE